jgi:protein arginine N-methyltransferase 5
VIAVEKNPNAVITLRELKRTHAWENRVTIHAADMRSWSPDGAALCDILVSELLGSFADNELSPECLDGVLHVLKPGPSPTPGLCIPQAYTSFMAPVSAYKAWGNARAYREAKYLETPYVVRLSRACTLDTPQPVFTFTHAAPGDTRSTEQLLAGLPCGHIKPASAEGVPDNRRYCGLRFTSAVSALVHGLAGYFDCSLTDTPSDAQGQRVVLSTLPSNHTPSMSSWFPIFFPLREPLTVEGGGVIQVHMWRCVSMSKRCVWYEWQVTIGTVTTHIHNARGSAYTIKL